MLTKQINLSDNLLKEGKRKEALSVLKELLVHQNAHYIIYFKIAHILNLMNKPLESYSYYIKAFDLKPDLARYLLSEKHPNYNYIYKETPQITIKNCPLCQNEGKPYSCYTVIGDLGFVYGFHPVRLWMKCLSCNHIYSKHVPKHLLDYLSSSSHSHYQNFKPELIIQTSAIISKLKELSPNPNYLDVGVGTGEMLAVAHEYLFDVEGLEVREYYANNVESKLGFPVYITDFNEFNPSKKYGVLTMGDVLEHMVDPTHSIKHAHSLLEDDGLLWISTPNFESAFCRYRDKNDPYWVTTQHFQFFSYHSLKKLLEQEGFTVVDYQISTRYYGSMEVTAKKTNP